jgi:hypothetical protein
MIDHFIVIPEIEEKIVKLILDDVLESEKISENGR